MFPDSLTYLNMAQNSVITTITMNNSLANTSLATLDLWDMPLLVSVPFLPTTIQYLQVQNSSNVNSYALSGFEDSSLASSCLLTLAVFNVPGINVLPTFPDSVTQLELHNCSGLSDASLPAAFPNSLVQLYIGTNSGITTLPSLANTSLMNLNIPFMPALISIPALPPTIEEIIATNCTSFTNSSFPSSFPNSLVNITVSGNNVISALPSFANTNLTTLDIPSLPLLSLIPALPSTIINIYAANANNDGSYALQGFTDSSLAGLTSLSQIALYNMKNASFVSPFPALPPSFTIIDIGGSNFPFNSQAYVEAIATNIVTNNPPMGGTFNAGNMGIPLSGNIQVLQTTYGWNVLV
jgi:hypothetical protein